MTLHPYSVAAKRLAVSPRTLSRLISAGEIATVRVRRLRRISDAEIDRFIREHTDAPRSVVSPFRSRR